MRKILLLFSVGLASALIVCGVNADVASKKKSTQSKTNISAAPIITQEGEAQKHAKFVATDTVYDVVSHVTMKDFSEYIFPIKNRSYDQNTRLDNVGSLLPYHSHINTETTLEVINDLIDKTMDGDNVFYEIYSDNEKAKEPDKEQTGLFFFRGKPGAPFAIVCAGGGFAYVGSIHESFPHALALSKLGYNAFALEYRIGSELGATEDLATAVSFVFRYADQLNVSTEDYSIWGGSAGARMAANIGSHGIEAFGGEALPKPSTVVIAYTGHSDYTKSDTPTFTMVSEDDPIVDSAAVDRRVLNLQKAGIDVEYQKYKNAGHGFGLGIGTDAEGWLYDAVAFWEKHQKQPLQSREKKS